MGRYIVVDKSAPKLSKLSKWYKSDKEEYNVELEDYCQQFAKEFCKMYPLHEFKEGNTDDIDKYDLTLLRWE